MSRIKTISFILLALVAGVSAQTAQPIANNTADIVNRTITEVESQLKLKECEDGRCWLLEGFLTSLKKGLRGDGIHHEWMDKMKNLGVKQASFIVDYRWNREKTDVSLKVGRILYYSEYYRDDKIIKDRKTLKLIRETGLEDDLKKAAVINARRQFQSYQKGTLKSHYIYEFLLDDENLPIISIVD